MIEQIRHNHKQGRLTVPDPLIGDRRRQVRFAATVFTGKSNPILRMGGKGTGKVKGPFQILGLFPVQFVLAQIETFKGLVGVQREAGQFRNSLNHTRLPEIGRHDCHNPG